MLLQHRPSDQDFPIIVSQDCGDSATSMTIESYANKGVEHIKVSTLYFLPSHLISIQQPDLSEPSVEPRFKNFKGYYKIARHYKWALTEMFDRRGFQNVIIVEDDLDISPVLL